MRKSPPLSPRCIPGFRNRKDRQRFLQRCPARFIKTAGFDAEAIDFCAGHPMDPISADFAAASIKPGSVPHLDRVVPQPFVRQLDWRRRPCRRIARHPQISRRMDTEFGRPSHLSHRRAEERIDAARGAARPGGQKPRFVFRIRLHEPRQASSMASAARQPSGMVRATPAVIRYSRKIRPISDRAGAAAKRIEEHRQIAARGLVQELAETLGGIGIKISFRRDPFTASGPQAFGSPVATKKISGCRLILARISCSRAVREVAARGAA